MGTWADWNASTKDEQKAAKAAAKRRGNTPPLWVLRKDLRWRPWADPGESLRSADVAAIEYSPIRMRFVMQEDGPWFHLMGKFIYRQYPRFVVSNSWNNTRPVPCLLWTSCVDAPNDEEKQKYYAEDFYALEVELLEDFHVVDVPAKRGNKTYEKWYRCSGVDEEGKSTCTHCDGGNETVFGRKVFMLFWESKKKQFAELIESKANQCAGCQEGRIQVYGFTCSNDSCDHVYGHKKTGPEYDEQDAKNWEENEATCPKCNHTDWAVPIFRCLHRKGYGKKAQWVKGCADPVYENPWLYTYVVKTTKSGRADVNVIEDFELIDDEDAEALPQLTGIPESLRSLDMKALLGSMDLKSQKMGLDLEDTPFDLEDAQTVLNKYFAAPADEDDLDSIAVDDDIEEDADPDDETTPAW